MTAEQTLVTLTLPARRHRALQSGEAPVPDVPRVLISHVCLSARFHLFPRSRHTWQVDGVKMTRAGARCCAALPVPALEAHGGAAGVLGHHIDLALTDTCREREV